jgi:hypothetical protein
MLKDCPKFIEFLKNECSKSRKLNPEEIGFGFGILF